MKRNIRSLEGFLKHINSDNLKEFDYYYYCRKEIKDICEAGNEQTIIEKFLHSYLGKVRFLCESYDKQGNLFMKWYNKAGKDKLILLTKQMKYDKIQLKSLVKFITRYELLLEQSISEDNVDGILNLLIDIPKKIYKKLKEWDCFYNGRIVYDPKKLESYQGKTVSNNMLSNIQIPAVMQVSLL